MRTPEPPLPHGAPAGEDRDPRPPSNRRGGDRLAAVGLALCVVAAAAAVLVARPRGEPPTAPDPRSEPSATTPPPLSTLAAAPRARSREAPPPETGDAAGPEATAASDTATVLAEIAADLESRRWAPAREKIEAFAVAHSDADDATHASLDALRERFTRDRRACFAEAAGRRLPELLRTRVAARVADPDVTYADASAWARKQGVEDTLNSLWLELKRADEAVTPEEVRAFWDGRPRTDASWKPMDRALLRWISGPLDRGAGEAWWRGASREERTEFLTIVIVPKSGLFEVDGDRFR